MGKDEDTVRLGVYEMSDSDSSSSIMEKEIDTLLHHGEEEVAMEDEHRSTIARLFTYCHGLWRTSSTRRVVIACVLAVLFIVGISSTTVAVKGNSPSHIPFSSRYWSRIAKPRKPEPFFHSLYEKNLAAQAQFPSYLEPALQSDFCSICDCQAAPSYYSPSIEIQITSGFPPRPLDKDVHPTSDTVDVNEYVRRAILDIYCARQHLTKDQGLTLVRRTSTHLNEMMSWSLAGLDVGKPTIYMTTVTSPNGKAGPVRPQYFRRHGRTIRSWMVQQEERLLQSKDEWESKKLEGDTRDWQVVWVIAEDETELDPAVIRTLQRTGVPYVYFAYGRTKSWGNAQKNAVLQMVYALSRQGVGGLYGHGPVYGLDDDNKILPELLNKITQVVRVGVVPVGNLGFWGWETPDVDKELGEVTHPGNHIGTFDYGGFAFNSSLLGTAISGPSFWKWTEHAGEREFLEQFATNMRSFEPLCDRKGEQTCHLAWHNEELTEVEKMTDEEEIAYVHQYGVDKLFKELGFAKVGDDDKKKPST
ncbi:nucleotide-diphospho-sugar transferase [Exophiala viscosa]|uniref:nucleotide-diphospho-sugar transferase n=1 Tax=Exophiala viscosa TaxID=2486360 RepID=UPI00219488D6|nr:nucleotide-diphospho-sugar transferase [Exophiala viscosa]